MYRTIGGLVGIWLVTAAAGQENGRLPLSVVFVPTEETVFSGRAEQLREVFDVVAADMDLDGDPDLFVNRHGPLELFENVGGRFELVNVAGSDRSGLFENRQVPSLYAQSPIIVAGIRNSGAPGIYLWHDMNRRGFWRFYVKRGSSSGAGRFEISLRAFRPIKKIVGLSESDYERLGEFDLRILLSDRTVNRTFGVLVDLMATQLKLELKAGDGDSVPTLFVGRDRIPMDSKRLSLWKPDPHGISWVQAEESPHPELFFARGALRGELKPPHEPKTNPLYVWQGTKTALYRMADDGIVPPDYGSGRQVAWADIDNDGANELYISNFESPNVLLKYDVASGTYRDRASEYRIGFVCGESFAWMDWNDDGFQDLIFTCSGRLVLARNVGGSSFEVVDGKDLGLDLPPARKRFFEPLSLQIFDFDNDGRLDLWIGGYGRELTNHLFLRKRHQFVDVTADMGLDSIKGTNLLRILDADNDGVLDAISVGAEIQLLRNIDGTGFFESRQLETGGREKEFPAATACDVDGDGRTGLVLFGKAAHLLQNRTENKNSSLEVYLGPSAQEPIGAIVRAHFADGSTQAPRYGSASNTSFSQALLPLHFGISENAPVQAVSVRWPGSTAEARYSVEPGTKVLRLQGQRPSSER